MGIRRRGLGGIIHGKDGKFVLIGGGILIGTALIVRLLSGSPYAAIRYLGASTFLPPLWLLSILWLGWFFLLGCACGFIFGFRRRGAICDVWRYRGGIYAVLAVALALMWYPLLFGRLSLFLSWVVLLLAIAATVICAICWFRICRGVGVVVLSYAMWLVVLFLLQFAVILHN